MTEEMGIGHCGVYRRNWVCDEPKLDDLCQGCPCNDEEDCEDDEE